MNKTEINEMLEYPCNYVGECDKCHQIKPLWIDEEEPGEFAYCEKCWAKIADRLKQKQD